MNLYFPKLQTKLICYSILTEILFNEVKYRLISSIKSFIRLGKIERSFYNLILSSFLGLFIFVVFPNLGIENSHFIIALITFMYANTILGILRNILLYKFNPNKMIFGIIKKSFIVLILAILFKFKLNQISFTSDYFLLIKIIFINFMIISTMIKIHKTINKI